ncbi:Retrovirus-related Pol poly from transposon [Labeo rohita]|uniref:Retrovirus-related Pol poly from transposon n=1 Tax=Labeo rohita TaxID=84645 RepID=A0A498N1M3_LABRO|nr:Retrovirus-related Pol poly from transposon [Labeo rohita]
MGFTVLRRLGSIKEQRPPVAARDGGAGTTVQQVERKARCCALGQGGVAAIREGAEESAPFAMFGEEQGTGDSLPAALKPEEPLLSAGRWRNVEPSTRGCPVPPHGTTSESLGWLRTERQYTAAALTAPLGVGGVERTLEGTPRPARGDRDEFVLTHRNVFPSVRSSNILLASKNTVRDFSRVPQHMSKSNGNRDSKSAPSGGRDRRSCFYCLDQGHLIAECQAWKKKNAEAKTKKAALVQTMSLVEEESMQPFLLSGSVSLSDTEHQPIVILQDTGSAQSFILKKLLPFSQSLYTGTDVLICGIEMGCDSVPLHQVHLKSDLVNGSVHLGVREQLPFDGVGLILGNDLAGGRVFPRPIVVNNSKINDTFSLSQEFPSTFPVCAITRAQSKKFVKTL